MTQAPREWLIADGLGGYAMGTADGIRTRRYHGLLLVAAPDSERRFMLVNGVEAVLEIGGRTIRLNAQRYAPDVTEPASREAAFHAEPWPTWDFEHVSTTVHGQHGSVGTMQTWSLRGSAPARRGGRARRAGRGWAALPHAHPAFRFDAENEGPGKWRFQPYAGGPCVTVFTNGKYSHAPVWYRRFQYDEERARGQDFLEDLGSPGEFVFELTPQLPMAVLMFGSFPEIAADARDGDAIASEHRRETAEHLDVDRYIVRRGSRRTIIAGYPWFTDWGRDTFISVRGLCIATGRTADAEAILLSWCDHLADGLMPNLFPSGEGKPEYNSVDAALWFIAAVQALSAAASGGGTPQVPLKFIAACDDILSHYSRGTRHNIRMDSDGLLAAGVSGMALTWMDAIVDGRPVTPRIGKPVEVQALWVNALEFAATWNARWRAVAGRARDSFVARFWNERRGCLYDVVDVDHVAGALDDRLRPNQVFACGGLPISLVMGKRAESILDAVERELWTPAGLRTLARGDAGYVGRVDGPLRDRDLGYHQGTVWPWLTGAFQHACSRSARAAPEALPVAFEIADGDAPHTPRGCPWQAWSVGEHRWWKFMLEP